MTAHLRVLEIFDSLQGEGAWAGAPMTFIRLAGCNGPDLDLDCTRWCDTPEAWDHQGGEDYPLERLVERVMLPRVCITGGEPLLQGEGVGELIRRLQSEGLAVHIETNGTQPVPPAMGPVWVTVSPKGPLFRVTPELEGSIAELKFVVDDRFSAETAEGISARHPLVLVYLQPEASGGREMVGRAVEAVMSHPAWRLSLQLHKIIGIP